MTEPITDEKFYNEHAALLGHVALAWNDCHSVVLSIFHTLSGVSWPNASSIFLALKSDHDRRETTLALMDQVLNTANDRPIRDQGCTTTRPTRKPRLRRHCGNPHDVGDGDPPT